MSDTTPITVAVYDFDGTVTDRHTFWRFLRLLSGPLKFWLTVVTMLPAIVGITFFNRSVMAAREVLIRRLLKGMSVHQMNELSLQFAQNDIPAWVKPEARRSIKKHKEAGHKVMLISNSASSYLKPWASSVGIETVYGSEFEVDTQERLTGELKGKHCQGREKLECLLHELGSLDKFELHVFGDSEGDLEMLDAADFAYYLTFDPKHRNDQRLAASRNIGVSS